MQYWKKLSKLARESPSLKVLKTKPHLIYLSLAKVMLQVRGWSKLLPEVPCNPHLYSYNNAISVILYNAEYEKTNKQRNNSFKPNYLYLYHHQQTE